MSIFKPPQHKQLVGQVRQGALRGVLIYGADSGGVAELSKRLIKAATGDSDDPMSVTILDDDICREDPARLADEMQSVSMFGGRTAIRVRAAGEAFAKAMENALAFPPGEVMVIAEAGPLKPASKLRQLFEKSKELACAPVYEDSAGDIRRIIEETLRARGLDIAPDALAHLAELLGADRAASRGELEKLALYCHGRRRVTLEDVQAACGDVSSHATDDMIDAFLTGDAARGARLFAALMASGTTPASLLTRASTHLANLKSMALAVQAGRTPQQALREAKPPIFFKRQDAVTRQIALWPLPALERADEGLFAAAEQTRLHPQTDAAIAERLFLSLAVRARRAQKKRR